MFRNFTKYLAPNRLVSHSSKGLIVPQFRSFSGLDINDLKKQALDNRQSIDQTIQDAMKESKQSRIIKKSSKRKSKYAVSDG